MPAPISSTTVEEKNYRGQIICLQDGSTICQQLANFIEAFYCPDGKMLLEQWNNIRLACIHTCESGPDNPDTRL